MNINGGTVRVSVVRVCTRREGAVADAILKAEERGEERRDGVSCIMRGMT